MFRRRAGRPVLVFNVNDDGNGNWDGNVDGLGFSVEGDSSQAQNDKADDNWDGNVNDDDDGNDY